MNERGDDYALLLRRFLVTMRMQLIFCYRVQEQTVLTNYTYIATVITCHHTRLHLFHSTCPGALSLALTAFHSLRPPVAQSLVLEFGDLNNFSPWLLITLILPT